MTKRPSSPVKLLRTRSRMRRRRGISLVETAISAILLTAVLLTAIPTLGWIVRARQAAERHQTAVLAAANLMERLTAVPWDELTPERAAQFALPEELQRQLPESQLRIAVTTPPDDPAGKRISIELRWQESIAGTNSAPVRLTAWAFPHDRRGT